MAANIVEVTDANFASEVLQAETLTLLDFAADWCGPCKMMSPILSQLATEREGSLKVAKLDVDHNPQTAARFNIRSIPALLFFRDGQVVGQIVGATPRSVLEQKITELS